MEPNIETYTIDPRITKTKKIVVNRCFGGFGLSKRATNLYLQYRIEQDPDFDKDVEEDDKFDPTYDAKRDDPILVRVVEELGKEANTRCSRLEIVEVRDQPQWEYHLREYDGSESVEEYFVTPDKKFRFTVDPRC